MILDAILYGFALLFYYLEVGLAELLDLLCEMFEVYAGMTNVKYNGVSETLIEVFLKDDFISVVYKGMACIGLCMMFAFVLVKVVKKLFDSTGEKVKQSYGDILISGFKSGLTMALMTAIILATTNACSVIMNSVADLFDSAGEINDPQTITFTDEDFGNMFRVIDTVADYGMNPSPETRFNVNVCFNEISSDMQTLEASRLFNYDYSGAEDSWQYFLRQIYLAADIHSDLPIDTYNEAVTEAITNLMYQTKYNSNFTPVKSYSRSYSAASEQSTKLGKIIMLSCSLDAGKNSAYNGVNANIYDNLRGPYYSGSKNLYNRESCETGFNLRFDYWHHLVCILCLCVAIVSMFKMCFNAIARLFNIVLLYIVSPPFIAVSPLDEGAKMKQWITAFIIQSCSIIGIYISFRLMIMFIPIIMSSKLVLFSGRKTMNAFAKIFLLLGVLLTADKSSAMITGILADNAGMQSVMAGDVGGNALGKAAAVGKAALGAAKKIGGGLADVTGLSTLAKKGSNKMQAMRDHGGIVGAARKGWKSKDEIKEDRENKAAEEADKKDKKDGGGVGGAAAAALGGAASGVAGAAAGGAEAATGAGQNPAERTGGDDGGNQLPDADFSPGATQDIPQRSND